MWKNGTHGVGVPYAGPKKRAGKLPYDLKVRAPKERKKKMLSFGHAAAKILWQLLEDKQADFFT
jgi:hypothetical protein